MPVALERKLKKQVAGKDMTQEQKDAYIYGTLRKTGWKPKREMQKNLSARLDNLIEFGSVEDARRYYGSRKFQEDQRRSRANTASVLVPAIGSAAVGAGTISAIGIKDKPIAQHDRRLMQQLNIEAQKAGGDVLRSTDTFTPGVAWRDKGTKSFLAKVQRKQVQRITGESHPPLQGVAIAPSVRPALKPGVLAHEIGHLQQPRWMTSTLAGVVGKWGPVGTGLYAGLTQDEKRAKIAAIAGTASAIPLMTREIDASIRGGKLLAKHGVGSIRRLSPGIGLASYAAASAAPAATYAIKKHMGGYKQMSAKLDDLIEFRTRASKIPAQVLGAQIPGVQSRRDPEERLRDRLSIAASLAKTGAGVGLGAAGLVGAYKLHKHGKGLFTSMKQSFEGMARTGPALEDLQNTVNQAKGAIGKITDVLETPEGQAVAKTHRKGLGIGERVRGFVLRKALGLSSKVQPIEFSARGFQYNKTIAETFQDMRKLNPGNPLTELLARTKINVPAPPRHSEEAKTAAQRLRIMKRSQELSPKPRPKIFESAEEPIQFGMFDLLKKAKGVVSGEARMARLRRTDQASKNIRENWLRTLPKERQDFFRANQKEYLSDPSKPIEFGILSSLDDIAARVGQRLKYGGKKNLQWHQGLQKSANKSNAELAEIAKRRPPPYKSGDYRYFDKQYGQSITGLSGLAKPIQFDASILGPWQGSKGHESKIDQLEFPAGMSPAAALALPFPMLMRFLNQRVLLQQQYSSSTAQFSAKLDGLIEFQAFQAINRLFGKVGHGVEAATGAVQRGAGALAGAGRAAYGAGVPAVQRGASALAGAAARGYGAAVPAVQRGASALAGAAQRGYGAAAPVLQRGIAAADTAAGSIRSAAGSFADRAAGAVGGAAKSAYGSATDKLARTVAARRAASAAKPGIRGYLSRGASDLNEIPAAAPAVAAAAPAAAAPVAASGPSVYHGPGASGAGIQSYIAGSHYPGGVNAPIGGTPPPVPAHLAASSAAGAVPAAAAPGTQATQAQAAANQAGQAAGAQAPGAHGLQPAAGGKPVEPGWWDKFKAQNDWSKFSTKKKWAVGGGAALAGGAIGGYMMMPSQNQQMGAWIDSIIHFDSRPRNPMGQFSPEEGGGPDRNAIAMTYGQHPIASAVGTGVVGGIAGQAGASGIKSLIEKLKKARAAKK